MKTITFRDKGERAKDEPFRKVKIINENDYNYFVIPEGRGLCLSLFKSKIEIKH